MLKSKFNARLATMSMWATEKSQVKEMSSQEIPTCHERAVIAAAIWEEFVFLFNCRRYCGVAGYEGEGGGIC